MTLDPDTGLPRGPYDELPELFDRWLRGESFPGADRTWTCPDPLRPPETDEEPWLPETAGPEPRRSLLARIRALLRRK